jgi:outer membrane protein TolC
VVNASSNVAETVDSVRTTNSSVGVSQLLRSGVVIGSNLTAQSQKFFAAPPPGSTTALGITITFPLLRGRGEEFVAAAENAARLIVEQSQYVVRHTTAGVMFSTATAYWNLRAAEESLAVLKDAESRAGALVGEIQKLIKAGERPAADINLINANLINKRTARTIAEQNLINARLVLAQTLGLDVPALQSINRSVDSFPSFSGKPVLIEDAGALVNRGLKNRSDIKAANANLEALRIAVNSARDNLKSILNLTVGAGNTGNTFNENPLLVFSRTPGSRQYSATLNYSWDVQNNTNTGKLISQSASFTQQEITIRALRLSVAAAIENAVAAYNSAAKQLDESRSTLELYNKVVENERKKLKLGSATLLDVVNVESQRQDAALALIGEEVGYANAIAALRYQIGELVSDDLQSPTQTIAVDRFRSFSVND